MRIRHIEPEGIVPLHRLKRRDIHQFLGVQLVTAGDFTQVGMVTKIAVAVAIGVCDFRDHRNQRAILAAAQPETDGIKDVAQNTRLRQKLDLGNACDLVLLQHVTHPSRAAPVTETRFERAEPQRPDALLAVYYDSREGLVARGVLPPPVSALPIEPEPEPFPVNGRFAPPPP